MKIIFVPSTDACEDQKTDSGFKHYNFYDTLANMNGGKNEVIYFPFSLGMKECEIEGMNKKLLELVIEKKPDLCFFRISGEAIRKKTVGEITHKLKIPTLNWFCDDQWRFSTFSKYWAPYFTWVVTTDFKAIEKYHKIGYKNVIKSQWSCNHFLYKPLNLPKIYDVTFVGQNYGERKIIIDKLRKAGIKVECWGNGWPNGRVSFEKMVEIFSQSKINLNFTRCSCSQNLFRSVVGIFFAKVKEGKIIKIKMVSPRFWIHRLKTNFGNTKNQIKGRNFEIPGCGTFLLTDDADNLRDYYQDGKEIVIFKDIKDLVQKIKYYLEHEKEREAIARAGYNRTIKDHTDEKRFNDIFEIIGNKK